jgi:putative DNA primase/helicase
VSAKIPTDDGAVTDVPHVVWDGAPVTVDAQTALGVPETPSERSEREEAKEFLRTILADGPAEATRIKREAKGAGIAERTLSRAKSDLGVTSDKDGFDGPWKWSLTAEGCQGCHIATHEEVGNLGNLRGEIGNLREPLDTPDLEDVGGLWEPARF